MPELTDRMEEALDRGGILIQCNTCKQVCVLPKTNEFAKDIRRRDRSIIREVEVDICPLCHRVDMKPQGRIRTKQ